MPKYQLFSEKQGSALQKETSRVGIDSNIPSLEVGRMDRGLILESADTSSAATCACNLSYSGGSASKPDTHPNASSGVAVETASASSIATAATVGVVVIGGLQSGGASDVESATYP
jgi:hypothetical protein